MKIEICDILNLDVFGDATLKAGRKGLNRKVKWFYLAETFPHISDVFHWTEGGELLFVIGHGISSNHYTLEELIKKAHENHISGIIIFVGEYIHIIPDAIQNLCNNLELPLITLPWHVKYTDASFQISQLIASVNMQEKATFDFLDSILFSESVPKNSILKRARTLGVDFDHSYHIAIIDIDNFDNYIEANQSISEHSISQLKSDLYDIAGNSYKLFNTVPVHMLKSDSVISLISCEDLEKIDFQILSDRIHQKLHQKYPEINISIGVGTSYTNIEDLKKSYKEADNTIKLQLSGLVRRTIFHYADLHIYRIFCDMNDAILLDRFCPNQLKTVIQYDQLHESDLVNTLDIYLNTGRSLISTAHKMYVHKNTVKYRIDKIKELTHLDLNDMDVCFNLMFEMRVCKFNGTV